MGFLDASDYDISQYAPKKIEMDSFNVSLYVNADISWVYDNFRMRKKGIVKALTTDYETVYKNWEAAGNGLFLCGDAYGEWTLVEDVEGLGSRFAKASRASFPLWKGGDGAMANECCECQP